ncbi:MAG: phage tail tube protein [Geminicoccaceae bacterium]
MGRVLTNNTSFRYAREATELVGSRGIGFLPGEDPGDGGGAIAGSPLWKDVEPNDITTFGSAIDTVSRNPIRRSRGRQKGTISDLDSAVEVDADITVDAFLDYIEGFMFATFSNDDLIFVESAPLTATDTYTVPSLSVSQAARLQSDANIDTLLFGTGYLIAGNNGLKTLATPAASTDTTLTVAENLVDEIPPTNARLEIAGARLADGEMALTVAAAVPDVSGRIGTLTFANVVPTSLGLNVGQIIFVVMPTAGVRGYARITALDATTMTLDRMDAALVADPGTGAVSELRFGQEVRDVASDNARFLQRSLQFEADYPGLAADEIASAYEYARGNFCSTLALNLDLSDKGVFSAAFLGTDTDVPTETRKVVASVSPADALSPLGTEAFSTVSDFARLRIEDIDEDGLTTDLKSVELTIDNNVSPEKVLNRLGARFINFGNFFVDLSTQLIFSDGNVLSRIRENTTVSIDMFLQNGDGVLAFSIPAMTLGDGAKELPTDETVLLNITGEAFEDPVTGASLNVSFIPAVPA